MSLANKTQGAIFALLAYLVWGMAPIYFKLLGHMNSVEILMHRVLWSALILAALLSIYRQWQTLVNTLCNLQTMLWLLLSAALLSINWWLFIYAINTNQILEASLGYYINPLLNVLLGYLVLKESMSKRQTIAVVLACSAVIIQLLSVGYLPWIPVLLASSFSVYGLVRKRLGVHTVVGLSVETLWLLPWAIYYALTQAQSHSDPMVLQWQDNVILLGCGVITTLPLLLFNAAAQRLKYGTLGFFQYLAPSLMFIIAVALYAEPLTPSRSITFLLVWTAIALYSSDAIKNNQR